MTRAEAEAAVRAAMARIGRPLPRFEFHRVTDGCATPHVEGEGPLFDWVISERGIEHERRRVEGPELVFIAVESLTGAYAQALEFQTREEGYSRATWMEAHVRLMARIDPEWGARVAAGYAETLARHPLSPDEVAQVRRLDLSACGLAG